MSIIIPLKLIPLECEMLYYRRSLGDRYLYCKIMITPQQIELYLLSEDGNQWSPLFIQKNRIENNDYLIYELIPPNKKNFDVIMFKIPKKQNKEHHLFLEFKGQSVRLQGCLMTDILNNPSLHAKGSPTQFIDSYNELRRYLVAITSQMHRNIEKPNQVKQDYQESLDKLPQQIDINAIKMEITRLENNAKSSFWGIGNQRKATKIANALINACSRENIPVTKDADLLQALATHRFGFFGKTTALKNVEKTLGFKITTLR